MTALQPTQIPLVFPIVDPECREYTLISDGPPHMALESPEQATEQLESFVRRFESKVFAQ